VAGLEIKLRDSTNLSLVSSFGDDDAVALCEGRDVVFVLPPAAAYTLQHVRVDGSVVLDILSGIVSRGEISGLVDFTSSLALALDVHSLGGSSSLLLLSVGPFVLVLTLSGLPGGAPSSIPGGSSLPLYEFLHG
jgi:hypothetical protein